MSFVAVSHPDVLRIILWAHRWMRGLRKLEEHVEKTQREIDVRSDLRRWDLEFPHIHHELIVRYVAGFFASHITMLICSSISSWWNKCVRNGSSRKR